MFNRIHQKLGTAGFIISIVALVAALGGGAYAASGGLSGKQKKEVEKIAKKYAGTPGAPGTAGAKGDTGAAGAKGDAGAAGANGTAGTNGTNGTAGTNGTSVTNTALAKGNTTCPEGGAEFKVGTGTATHACNGVTGFTETLPSGKTETGTWNVTVFSPEFLNPTSFGSISFSIPLAAPGESFVFTRAEVENEEWGRNETEPNEGCTVGDPECSDTGCRGSLAVPTAPAGTLCLYTRLERLVHTEPERSLLLATVPSTPGVTGYGVSGANLSGILLEGSPEEPASAILYGTWAVTAP